MLQVLIDGLCMTGAILLAALIMACIQYSLSQLAAPRRSRNAQNSLACGFRRPTASEGGFVMVGSTKD